MRGMNSINQHNMKRAGPSFAFFEACMTERDHREDRGKQKEEHMHVHDQGGTLWNTRTYGMERDLGSGIWFTYP